MAWFAIARAGPAQPAARAPVLGFLISETLAGTAPRIDTLRASLRELGHAEGRNLAIVMRAADGDYERLPALAAELIALKVDVLVAFGFKATVAARSATATIPIVVPLIGDPVGLGLATGYAKPGGNITGSSVLTPEIAAKQLALLRESMPRLARVAYLRNPANASTSVRESLNAAAAALKLTVQVFETRAPRDFAAAFSAMTKAGARAVLVSADTLFRVHIKEVAELALKHRLPTVSAPEFAEAGLLIGYGALDAEMYRRGAYFVDRILKGARPADLPIERASRFDLVINNGTAKALGIRIPASLVQRADRVID